MLRSGPVRLGLIFLGSAIFALLVVADILSLAWLVVGPVLVVLLEMVLSTFVGRTHAR